MNTLESSIPNNSSSRIKPDWFEAIVPFSAIPLILVLLLILPVFFLAAESLFAPVYDYVASLLMPVNAGVTYTRLPLLLIIKIGIFAVFTFTGVTLLLLKLSCLYHEVWSYFFYQPHPKHVPYHPDQQESMIALFNWNLFRWFKIIGPVVGWASLTAIVGAVSFWISNTFTDFGFFTFQLQFTLGFFAVLTLSFFTMLAFFKAIWAAFTTVLGDVTAVTEPEKPAQICYDRCRKLAFASPWSLFLYPLYFLFYTALIVEVVLLVAFYDISDLLTLKADLMMIFGFEVVTLVVFLMLSAMKFMVYHDAVGRYYQSHVR